jgi:hypothetical protein
VLLPLGGFPFADKAAVEFAMQKQKLLGHELQAAKKEDVEVSMTTSSAENWPVANTGLQASALLLARRPLN